MLGTAMKGDITASLEKGQRLFHAYGDTFFQLGTDKVESSLYFHAGKLSAPWLKGNIRDLQASDLIWLKKDTPELLVIGTGKRTSFPEPEVLEYLSSLNIGFECMDSLSAARTFNILVGEGRKVSAAMLLPNSKG